MAIVEAAVAAAKVGKYATSESGDTLEMVERPGGGISFVLADGQRSGKPAKAISNIVTRKAISLLAEGVRDGAAARAASDYLFTYRSGKVLATLNILSIDLQTQTMVIARNNPAPIVMVRRDELIILDDPAQAVGPRRGLKPAIREFALEEGLCAVVFTDGLIHAGERSGRPLDVPERIQHFMQDGIPDPVAWADHLLEEAVRRDQGRPTDDITILVAAILDRRKDEVRRLYVRMAL